VIVVSIPVMLDRYCSSKPCSCWGSCEAHPCRSLSIAVAVTPRTAHAGLAKPKGNRLIGPFGDSEVLAVHPSQHCVVVPALCEAVIVGGAGSRDASTVLLRNRAAALEAVKLTPAGASRRSYSNGGASPGQSLVA